MVFLLCIHCAFTGSEFFSYPYETAALSHLTYLVYYTLLALRLFFLSCHSCAKATQNHSDL